MSITYDPLIYGKNNLERIVSIEPGEESVEIFQQKEDGTIFSTFEPLKYWILSDQAQGRDWIRLEGNLHYKWGRQFSSREDFSKVRSWLKKNNHEAYSIWDARESFMVKNGHTYYKGMKPNELSILSFDLETTGLDGSTDDVLLISNTFRNSKGAIERRLFAYDEYESEADFVADWCEWVKKKDPNLIVGHNIIGFDFNFLLKKHRLSLGRNNSNLDQENYESRFRVDGTRELNFHKVRCYGREIIDTMFLAYRYDIATKKYDSYGLKNIIKQEGLEKADRQFYDASQIRFKYKDPVEWAKIKEYCIHDSDDSLALFDLMCPPAFYSTQTIPRSFQSVHESATGAHINGIMVRAYLQDKHSLPKASESVDFEGAISLGNAGLYSNVHKVDVASLYPSIMIQYEVFDKDKDPKEYFKKLVKTFTELRLEYKKKAKEDKYYDDLQSSFKIFINSAYGFLGTRGLLFNSPANAALITRTGREILTKCMDWAERNGKILVNADTDSISYCEGDMSFMSKEQRKSNLDEINKLYPPRISWEDDGYYQKVCVLKAKNYILKDESGKVKIKGAAVKVTSKEPALREFVNKIIDSILNDREDFKEIYETYVQEILNVKDIRRWSSKKTLSNTMLQSDRTNETVIIDAIEGTEYKEGDRFFVFYDDRDKVTLVEKFTGRYSKLRLLGKLYDTAYVFDTILVTEDLFTDYSLLKHFKVLDPEQAEIHRSMTAVKRQLAKEKRILKIRAEGGII